MAEPARPRLPCSSCATIVSMRVRVREDGPWLCLVCGEQAVRLQGGPLELTFNPDDGTLYIRLRSGEVAECTYSPHGVRIDQDRSGALVGVRVQTPEQSKATE